VTSAYLAGHRARFLLPQDRDDLVLPEPAPPRCTSCVSPVLIIAAEVTRGLICANVDIAGC
jgi:hypothetical protein